MLIMILIDLHSPIRGLTCILCLVLLFLESSFGICLGCLLYYKLGLNVENCAGGQCEIKEKNKISSTETSVLLVFICSLFLFNYILSNEKNGIDFNENKIEKKTQEDNKIKELSVNLNPEGIHKKPISLQPQSTNNSSMLELLNKDTPKEDCIPPEWAIKIGHGEMWKQHHCN